MGLLSVGTPLDWNETKKHSNKIRKDGIDQFVRIYKKFKNAKHFPFKWGDEIEYSLIRFDHENKKVQLLLKAEELLEKLKCSNETNNLNVTFHPEYTSYMIESTPKEPFSHDLNVFKNLEENMELRRKTIEDHLEKNEHCILITSFPLLGCNKFTYPSYSPTPDSGITRSLFFPDQAIFDGHPRFRTLSNNIRERRNKNVKIYVPIFKDKNTTSPFIEELSQFEDFKSDNLTREDHVYLGKTFFIFLRTSFFWT
ncbi:unnamed protein product [Brachionus calyciflorus]|uniref:Glutamate--cysteine ligase n=1 Tax=Brachionus calyciflorus TaxID=104777 RepID=A0A814IZE1_9BILA|nr:unnamed protein product [Brachionus calyciflorus]